MSSFVKIGVKKDKRTVLIKNRLLLMKRKFIEISLLLRFFYFFEEFARRNRELLVGWMFVMGVVCTRGNHPIIVFLNKR